jgi:hypothetical protein
LKVLVAVAVTSLLSSLTQAAELQSARVDMQDEELEEIVVSAAKVVRSRRAMLSWLQRLVGHYSYEGYVELGGEGAAYGRETAIGAGKCVPLDEVAVLCETRVQWPEIVAADEANLSAGVSALSPAITLYGYDDSILAIRSLQVDSRGMANGGPGELRGNTLTTSTPCVDLPGDCKRVSRVSAQPDGKMIRMEIEIVREAGRVAHYVFQARRVAEVPKSGKGNGQSGKGQ